LLAACATAAAILSNAAQAADVAEKNPVYKAVPAEFNPWMIRVRAVGVLTRDSGWVDTVANSGLSTSDTVIPELDVSYFFTKNIAAELILGTTRHSVTGTGSIAGLPVGKAWLLPATRPSAASPSPTAICITVSDGRCRRASTTCSTRIGA
jgi:outer membrane protein